MKVLFTLFALVLVIQAGAQEKSLEFDGRERTYLVHLPADYTDQKDYPLVLGFHGGFGSATQMESHYHINEVADKNGFIVVYANGVGDPILNIQTWNAGVCCGYARKQNIDDVGFVNVLLDELIDDYAIDTSMVYATGMSNGAFMCYRLACELSYRFAAIAPVAGSMGINCNAAQPVSVIHFHSINDESIPYQGGVGSGVSSHYNAPIDSVLNVWAEINNCDKNEVVQDDNEYRLETWKNGKCGSEMAYYLTQDGGHSWPGGERATILADKPSEFINASEVMWSFFKNHRLDCPSNISKVDEVPWKVYPNPVKHQLHLKGEVDGWALYNPEGSLIHQETMTSMSVTLNMSHLPIGIYFIKVHKGNRLSTLKVVKVGE